MNQYCKQNLEKAIPKAIGFLNYPRNSFAEIEFPIVSWCKDYVCDKIANESQDFWAWRSKVFEFRSEEKVLQSIAIEMLSKPIQYKSLKELNRRIKIYEKLIKEDEDKGIEDNEKIADFYFNLGFYYYSKGEYNTSIGYYNKSLKIKKN